jgi:hypothetical protein
VTVVETLARFPEATVTEHGPTVEIDLDRTIGNTKMLEITEAVQSARDFGEWVVYGRLVTHWKLRRYNVGQLAEGLGMFREEG